jgi:hypothetical protein
MIAFRVSKVPQRLVRHLPLLLFRRRPELDNVGERRVRCRLIAKRLKAFTHLRFIGEAAGRRRYVGG